ncbi:MAG: hypothetical protein AB1806_12630 [Acidobacteriota bacterium]
MELALDFDEFFGSLTAHNVEFLVVGAYALAFHGVPRFTGDIDVFIRPTTDNGQRLLAALKSFGFPVGDLTPEQVIDPRRVLQMGVEPVQIHVMSDISGVTWDEAWATRETGHCGSRVLPFIGRRQFIKNKKASGRLKDLADVEALEGEATKSTES